MPRFSYVAGRAPRTRSPPVLVEDRSRLVEDQHAGVERERLGDLDHLLLGDTELTDRSSGIDRHRQPFEQLQGASANRPAIDSTKRSYRIMAEEDVLLGGQMGRSENS